MTKKTLFFVAALIPEPFRDEVRAFQEYASEHFHSVAALRIMPHITLVPPFDASEAQVDKITDALKYVGNSQKQFEISLNGFGSFGKHVIYIQVTGAKELKVLADALGDALRKRGVPVKQETRLIHPHVTVAYKDLGTEVFDEAFGHFSHLPFSGKFVLDSFMLLRFQHGHWREMQAFPLAE